MNCLAIILQALVIEATPSIKYIDIKNASIQRVNDKKKRTEQKIKAQNL